MSESDAPTYIIISRDHPGNIAATLDSIRAFDALRGARRSDIWVVDDSGAWGTVRQVEGVIRARPDRASTRHVGQRDDARLWSRLEPDPNFRELREAICRPLGSSGWNLGCARNCAALLAVAELPPDALVCFLDDDVRLTAEAYEGTLLRPSAARLFEDCVGRARAGERFALGPVFLGREDISISHHLAKTARMPGKATRSTDVRMPVHVAETPADLAAQPRVPSGGCLLTTPRTLALAPQFPVYNEDWIWGLMVSSEPEVTVGRTWDVALHVPRREHWCGVEKLLHQELGELIWDTLTDIVDGAVGRGVMSCPSPAVLDTSTDARIKRLKLRRDSITRAESSHASIRTQSRARGGFVSETHRELAARMLQDTIDGLERTLSDDIAADLAAWLGQTAVWREVAASLSPVGATTEAV